MHFYCSYVSFVLMLTISLAKTIQINLAKNENSMCHIEKLNERSLIKYSDMTIVKDVFPDVQTENFRELFSKSHFVTSSMANLWHLAQDFLRKEK